MVFFPFSIIGVSTITIYSPPSLAAVIFRIFPKFEFRMVNYPCSLSRRIPLAQAIATCFAPSGILRRARNTEARTAQHPVIAWVSEVSQIRRTEARVAQKSCALARYNKLDQDVEVRPKNSPSGLFESAFVEDITIIE
jgi:hypothetical protein